MLIRPLAKRPREIYLPQEEPPNLKGLLFMQKRDETVEVLRYSGESSPETPPDIPDEAVIDGRVYISVDGIGQNWDKHRSQIRDWFHGGADYGVKIPGPVIGIHEGEGKSSLHDGVRVFKNTLFTKALQKGVSPDTVREKIYHNDPSVKAIHDQLAQSLRVGREVTLMAHSGGGSQVALALALMAQDENNDWKPAISEKVRVLGTASAGHRKDLEWARVASDNIMMTGSERDPVYRFYRNHIDVEKPWTLLRFLSDGVGGAIKFALKPGPFHQGEYIFAQNINGESHRIGDFLSGGVGRDAPLP
jgi:hypothetical protein